MKRTFSQREINIHVARVMIREASLRRHTQPGFSAVLLQWAANARRRAIEAKPTQGELQFVKGQAQLYLAFNGCFGTIRCYARFRSWSRTMTSDPLVQAATKLATELGLNPSVGSVWAWRERGRDEIVVQLQRPTTKNIPSKFLGYHVRVRKDLEPSVTTAGLAG